MKKFLNFGYFSILVFYVYLLIDTVFFARDARQSINLVPFDMIKQQGFTLGVWGNIIMFIPIGLYLANFLKGSKWGKVVAGIVGASLSIEVLQYVFKRGASDIDDLILNTAGGGLIGVFIYLVFKVLFKSNERVHTAISVLSILVGLPVLLLTIILVVVN